MIGCVASTLLCFFMLGCGGSSASTAGVVATLSISPTNSSIAINQQQTYTATAMDSSGNVISGPAIIWTSSSPSVATIDSNGIATGLTAGSTQITASSNNVTSSGSTLTVVPAVGSVTISPLTASVAVKSTVQFSAVVKDPNGNVIANATVQWSISASSIATIDSTGKATGVSPGAVTVVASSGLVSSQAASLTVTP